MPDPLTTQRDVETALIRPLTTAESVYIDGLIDQASALLRQAAPSIDDRIARYSRDPSDLTAVSDAVVSAVLAGVVKKYIINPTGIASQHDSEGPFSHAVAYALRSEKETRGVLQITQVDLAALFPNRKRLRAGTIRLRPALAPRPVGRYGPIPTVGQAVAAVIDFDQDGSLVFSETFFSPLIVPESPGA